MAQVMLTDAEDVSHKSLLEQETKEFESELESYEEKLHEFARSKSETIDRIDKEVNKGEGFAIPTTPRPATEQVSKYVARDDLRPNILCEEATMELFKVWSEAMLDWFWEVCSNKGTNARCLYDITHITTLNNRISSQEVIFLQN